MKHLDDDISHHFYKVLMHMEILWKEIEQKNGPYNDINNNFCWLYYFHINGNVKLF